MAGWERRSSSAPALTFVIPAKAGIQQLQALRNLLWTPAFAGVTRELWGELGVAQAAAWYPAPRMSFPGRAPVD